MKSSDPLYLQEEVMLLALRDEKGTACAGSMFMYAVGAAILSELLLSERVEVDESSWRKLVNVIDNSPTGDAVLDECLQRMATAKRRANLQAWITRFASKRGLKSRIAEGLCRRGILKADEGSVLLIFKRKIYPERDAAPERAIVKRLRHAIFTDTSDIDAHTVILATLAQSADLLKMVFEKRELRDRKARIKKLATQQPAGKATAQAIAAVQAAAAAVVIMASTSSSG